MVAEVDRYLSANNDLEDVVVWVCLNLVDSWASDDSKEGLSSEGRDLVKCLRQTQDVVDDTERTSSRISASRSAACRILRLRPPERARARWSDKRSHAGTDSDIHLQRSFSCSSSQTSTHSPPSSHHTYLQYPLCCPYASAPLATTHPPIAHSSSSHHFPLPDPAHASYPSSPSPR